MPRDFVNEDLGSAAGAGSYALLQPTAPATAAELMATPDHMLAWLRSKHSDDIVAKNMWGCGECLGATFLRENGYPDARWLCTTGKDGAGNVIDIGHDSPTAVAISHLCDSPANTRITAARAIEALTRALAS